tara:strand:- start:1128 stop:1436 length:309 start_codon:yes stop_codon:yes gene_type:complete
MKKIILFITVLILILSTSFIKNSTKKIEDKIFNTSENIRFLNKNLNNAILEHNYLSSTEKLINYNQEYFDNNLYEMDITKIKTLSKKNGKLFIKNIREKSLK